MANDVSPILATDLLSPSCRRRAAPGAGRGWPCAHAQRQLADVLTVADQTVEGIELDFLVVLPAMQAVEV